MSCPPAARPYRTVEAPRAYRTLPWCSSAHLDTFAKGTLTSLLARCGFAGQRHPTRVEWWLQTQQLKCRYYLSTHHEPSGSPYLPVPMSIIPSPSACQSWSWPWYHITHLSPSSWKSAQRKGGFQSINSPTIAPLVRKTWENIIGLMITYLESMRQERLHTIAGPTTSSE